MVAAQRVDEESPSLVYAFFVSGTALCGPGSLVPQGRQARLALQGTAGIAILPQLWLKSVSPLSARVTVAAGW